MKHVKMSIVMSVIISTNDKGSFLSQAKFYEEKKSKNFLQTADYKLQSLSNRTLVRYFDC